MATTYTQIQLLNSRDLRNIPGNYGVVIQIARPAIQAGFLLYFWDDTTDTLDDADEHLSDGMGGLLADSPGVWAYHVKPTGTVGNGVWTLNTDSYVGFSVNPDWSATSGPASILNKPSIPSLVNADWNSSAGASQILNKPAIPAVPQAARITTAANGTYTWTFPNAFPSGVIPVVQITPEDSGTGVTVTHKITSISNTSATVATTRTSASAVALLGITLLQVQSNAATVLHLSAQSPT